MSARRSNCLTRDDVLKTPKRSNSSAQSLVLDDEDEDEDDGVDRLSSEDAWLLPVVSDLLALPNLD